jgi:peptidoglycan/LPS O-acetylase OafA/YrhL
MKEPARFVTLDAMRGVAAMAVAIYHVDDYLGYKSSAPLAVDFFFVLSGFVVAYAYDERLAHGMSFRQFAEKRAIRLYPLYFLGQLLGLVAAIMCLWLGRPTLATWEIAASLVLGMLWLPSPFQGVTRRLFPLNNPSWSLFWEVVVNAAYGLFHKRLTTPVLLGTAAAGGLGVLYYALATHNTDVGTNWKSVPGGAARAAFSFSVGVLLSRHRALIPQWLGRTGPAPLLVLLGLLLMLPRHLLTDLLFIAVGSPLIVAAGSRVTGDDLPLFRFLGAISFPLYAIHRPLLDPLNIVAGAIPLPRPLIGLTYVAAMIWLAWLVVPIDIRVRAYLTRQANRRGARITSTRVEVP